MIFKQMVGRLLTMLLILGASLRAGAQAQVAHRTSLPQRGSQKYCLMLDEFADSAVHLAYAKRFLQLHEGSLNDREWQQYSRIAADYADQFAAVRQAGTYPQSEFWNDLRAYSTSMIGASGVPIPGHRSSKYRLTTGSAAEDSELRRIVSVEIDEASSQIIRTVEY